MENLYIFTVFSVISPVFSGLEDHTDLGGSHGHMYKHQQSKLLVHTHPHAYLHAAVCEIRSSQPGLSSRNCWFAFTHCTCVLCTASGQWNCIRRYFSNSLFWQLCMRSPGQNFPEQTLRWTARLGTWQHGRGQMERARGRVACVCTHVSMVCQW